jgi:hypothetical protein
VYGTASGAGFGGGICPRTDGMANAVSASTAVRVTRRQISLFMATSILFPRVAAPA